MAVGYGSFEFDLLPPLVDQLVSFIESVQLANLNAENLEPVQDEQGIYVLFYKGERVYVGKTDNSAGLFTRLDRHRRNIGHRHLITTGDVTFKAIRVAVFTAMDLETELIRVYGRQNLVWNGSGFGSNDPGKERDKTKERVGNYDFDYPLDLTIPIGPLAKGPRSVADVLAEVRGYLTYTLRFENAGRGKKPHADLEETFVEITEATMSVRQILELIITALPAGWQITRLHGRILGYKKVDSDYRTSIEFWRSPHSPKPHHSVQRELEHEQ